MNILVLRSGTLGDTLVTMPALWALRNAFPDAHIKYVCETLPDQSFTEAPEVLRGTGLVDSFDSFSNATSLVNRVVSRSLLFWKLRREKWDLGISLAEPFWSVKKKRFAQLCGARVVFGPEGKGERHPCDTEGKLIRMPHIADTLLKILSPLSIDLPEPQRGRFDLGLSSGEEAEVTSWLQGIGAAEVPQPWIALGPWSKMPAKRWPLDRYEAVVQTLIEESDVTPFVFGSASDRAVAEDLIRRWERGYVVCGDLGLRAAVKLMSSCALYLGNDTGTMHMAASAGLPCVAIFSSRDSPGRWEPYGQGHTVLRKWVSCEGCMLQVCTEEKMRCILSISAEEATDACRRLLSAWQQGNSSN